MEPFVEDHHLVGFAVQVPDQPRSRLDGCSRLASVRTRRDYQQPLARGGFQPVNRLFLQPIGDRSGEQLPAQIGCGLMIRLGPLRSELIDRQLSQGTNPLLDSIGVCQSDHVLCSAEDAIAPLSGRILLRVNHQSHALPGGSRQEPAHRVRLPAGRGHQVAERRAVGTQQ